MVASKSSGTGWACAYAEALGVLPEHLAAERWVTCFGITPLHLAEGYRLAALAAQSPDEGSGYLSVFAATNLQACCLFAALQPMDPQRMGLTIYQRSAALDMLIAKFDPNYMHRDDYWQTLEQLYQRLAVGAVSQQELLEGVHRRIELEEAEARSLDRDTCPVCLERDLDFCRVHTGKNRRVKQLKQCLARLAGLRRVERYMAGQLQPTS